MGTCRVPRGERVSAPHPGDPDEGPRPRHGSRKRSKSSKLSGPEWQCSLCVCVSPSEAYVRKGDVLRNLTLN